MACVRCAAGFLLPSITKLVMSNLKEIPKLQSYSFPVYQMYIAWTNKQCAAFGSFEYVMFIVPAHICNLLPEVFIVVIDMEYRR